MKNSFKYAFSGLCAAVRSERNLRVHLAFAFYVLLAAATTGVSRAEWCVVVLCIGVVIAAELVNTAIEKLCDRISREMDRDIGLIKDLAAGAVLVFALSSVVAGGIIFFNSEKISKALDVACKFPVFAALTLVTVPVAAYLVFRKWDNGSSKD